MSCDHQQRARAATAHESRARAGCLTDHPGTYIRKEGRVLDHAAGRSASSVWNGPQRISSPNQQYSWARRVRSAIAAALERLERLQSSHDTRPCIAPRIVPLLPRLDPTPRLRLPPMVFLSPAIAPIERRSLPCRGFLLGQPPPDWSSAGDGAHVCCQCSALSEILHDSLGQATKCSLALRPAAHKITDAAWPTTSRR